ncbi:hypothetical protein Tco_1230967 [Tanacetum coccineum]
MAFGGNKRDLGSFREETDKITDLHQIHVEVLFTERGDGVACIKRRRHDLSSDGVRHSCTGHQVLFYWLISRKLLIPLGEWNISNIKTIVNVLSCFFMASGLKIDLHKSKLSGIGVSKAETDLAASVVGCSTFSHPFHHLGVKIGSSMSRIISWKEVTDKISSRLLKWKIKTLSSGGRLTLLKFVLTALPLYYMSIYKAPAVVLKDLESIIKVFPWR